MSEQSRINRKFERLLRMPGEQMCCRDYLSMDEQRRLAAQDSNHAVAEDSDIVGKFIYDFNNNTYVFEPSENYKK